MKIKTTLLAITAFASIHSALAQTTEITITGATAFRQATMRAIYDAYASVGPLGSSFNVAHDFTGNNLSQLIASNKAIFSGTFPGITGTTIIRTSFNGSTEGLNAIAGNNNPPFLTLAALGTPGPVIKGGTTAPIETLRPKFSFSDVFQSTSPINNEVLQPVGNSKVGVVTFTMIANNGAPAHFNNVTIQHCRALWQQGYMPLSIFTGNLSDSGTLVFATGRNDGSGTRSAYLTEWLYGAANPVNQYVCTTAGLNTNGVITAITLVPQGGTGTGNLSTSGGTSNTSNLWGNDIPGNGGYSSGSALRSHLTRTSNNVTVYDGNSQTPILTNQNILLLTWLSTADAQNAAAQGAKILAYNGVQITPLASNDPNNYNGTGFNQADFNKIISGAYSAWSYQHLYHHGSLSPNEQTWRNAMVNTYIPQGLQITANGVKLSDMLVERSDDGFPITPSN